MKIISLRPDPRREGFWLLQVEGYAEISMRFHKLMRIASIRNSFAHRLDEIIPVTSQVDWGAQVRAAVNAYHARQGGGS